ncbi:MAG: hypothetical protein J7L45_00060 [Candidatus Aenigmarchaeota archaeon]|nr:hypothetical protein [Candidatus Aenigmarchaeota archaeon]
MRSQRYSSRNMNFLMKRWGRSNSGLAKNLEWDNNKIITVGCNMTHTCSYELDKEQNEDIGELDDTDLPFIQQTFISSK